MHDRLILGVDVGGTSVKVARFDLKGAQVDGPHRFDPKATASAKTILTRFQDGLKPFVDWRLCGIGIGFPGPFDYENGICRIRGLGKFDAIYGVNVKDELRRRLNLPQEFPIVFINDASAYALGESRGAASGWRRTVVVTLGTGCGSAFLVDGKLVTQGPGVPENGWIYHLPFREGSLDDYLSRRGILALWREMGGLPKEVDVLDLARMAAEGSQQALVLFQTFGEMMGEALAPLLMGFRADGLVVGGQIAKSFSLFGPALVSTLERLGARAAVRKGEDLDGSALKGAALAALEAIEGRSTIREAR